MVSHENLHLLIRNFEKSNVEPWKVYLTYTGQREPHLVHFDLLYEGHTHAVGQHHERGDDVHDGLLRQRTGQGTDETRELYNQTARQQNIGATIRALFLWKLT